VTEIQYKPTLNFWLPLSYFSEEIKKKKKNETIKIN
jgi:hypothetical protein